MNTEEKKQIIREIKKDIKDGAYKKAFQSLNQISAYTDDFVMQSKYANIFKAIHQDELNLKKVRVAILASSTVSHFNDILRYWLAKDGFSVDIYEAAYNTVQQTILDTSSGLYNFNPDIVMIFTTYRDVKCDISPGSSLEDIQRVITSAVNDFTSFWKILRQNSNCYIIQNNADLPYYRSFGNYEGTALWGYINMLRNFNLELAKAVLQGVTIFDLDYISSVYGKEKWHEMRYWYYSKHAFALDATGLVAYNAAKVICSIKGSAKKCLVLDLDNTLWGGVIGDDGLDGIKLGNGPDGEAFVDFQKFLLKLKERGIILAVCSKGDEEIVKEPFLKHPDMQIKLEDIMIFKANWDNKVSNIKEIAFSLNIGLDSIVFVDDNPAERQLVKGMLPMVCVPELPKDPVDYISTLSSHLYFETVLFSDEDKVRSDYYRSNIKRSEFKKQVTNLSEYLQNLQMQMTVNCFDNFHLPRIAQLINKSNQFHLTTTRYTEREIKSAQMDRSKYCRYFKLKDRFGDNGLISVVILEKQADETLFVDTWVMSCRVLSRGVEEFICNEIVSLGKQIGCKKIIGKYIPTKKNRLVSHLYERLHFEMIKEEKGTTFWVLKLDKNTPTYQTFIKKPSEEKKRKV